ncbi:CoB--CoM heterodisulfide reductase iron-sulfur subunit B family protein [Desulfovirgula thermocuniculi]|uniref:CoB--CoM heterodisulfide reductase iron-sulfur subunit B family protein n=1 Tax=Desulfovirgula thermocuniculi TaxID=348842 RepID=UPI000401AE97|nr:CoB--CoM heterodisulfide reductase iron-sulfur subunit B family protein [Desulfovirgula thermocuniculi]
MEMPYFPGCTLYRKAENLDASTRSSLAALGVKLIELPRWTCCGAVVPLARDNYMGMVAAARILADAAKMGKTLATVCSFCYNVLKQVNYVMQRDPEARQKLNNYLEEGYRGEVRVIHALEICRQNPSLRAAKDRGSGYLRGLKVACYYGCTLLRPAAVALDDAENPAVMEEMVAVLGAEAVAYPLRTACCGSYQVLHEGALVAQKVREIIASASAAGAEVIITSCPLCQFNLDWWQERFSREDGGFRPVPVLYFTQLLGMALGVPPGDLGLERHLVDPRPLLSGAPL